MRQSNHVVSESMSSRPQHLVADEFIAWAQAPKCQEKSSVVEEARRNLRTLLYQFERSCQIALLRESLEEIKDNSQLPRYNSSSDLHRIEKKMSKMTKLLEALAVDVKYLKANSYARHVVRSIQSLLVKQLEAQ